MEDKKKLVFDDSKLEAEWRAIVAAVKRLLNKEKK